MPASKAKSKCIWIYKVSFRDWQGVPNKHYLNRKTEAMRLVVGAVQKGYTVTIQKITEDEK